MIRVLLLEWLKEKMPDYRLLPAVLPCHVGFKGGKRNRPSICPSTRRAGRLPPLKLDARLMFGIFWRLGSVNAAIRVVSVLLSLSLSFPAFAEQQGFHDALLDRMVGDWLLSGDIGGNQVIHDVAAEWVLGHQYLRFHEVAREVDSEGTPAYEAIVFIGWDHLTNRYTCLWLDVTGSGARFPDATARTR